MGQSAEQYIADHNIQEKDTHQVGCAKYQENQVTIEIQLMISIHNKAWLQIETVLSILKYFNTTTALSNFPCANCTES